MGIEFPEALLVLGVLLMPDVIPLLFGAEWEPAVLPTQLLTLVAMRQMAMMLMGPLFQALGKTKQLFSWTVVAVAANDWCVDANGGIEPARLDALIAGYAGIRPFTASEFQHLPAFLLHTTLASWLARLTTAIGCGPQTLDRAKDLEAFARIVALRRAQPAHVDGWQSRSE